MNPIERIAGLLISGFATKCYAAGLAIWAASEAARIVTTTLAPLQYGLAH